MFDFEKLEVYGKAKKLNNTISSFLASKKIDRVTHDQLRRASFSIMLNIAEGSGRFTKTVWSRSFEQEERQNQTVFVLNTQTHTDLLAN